LTHAALAFKTSAPRGEGASNHRRETDGDRIALMVDHDPYEPETHHAGYDDLEAPVLRRTRRRRRPRGAVHVALKWATVVIALTVGVLVGGYVYLGQGPISLESLRPAIAESLQSRLSPGYHVALGPIAISRGAHGVGIGFRGLSIRDSAGRLVVSAPGGRISLDALALLALGVKVRRLELDGLQLALRVGPNGELSLSAGNAEAAAIPLGPPPATPMANNLGALVAAAAESMAGADEPLDHVAIMDGKLTVQTAGRDQPAVYDDLKLAFDRSGSSASASLAAHGPSGDWRIAARAQSGSTKKLTVEAHELSVDDFLRLDPHPPRFSFDSPISFNFTAVASPSGALSALDGEFSIGAGRFDPHDPDGAPPIAIDEATGKASLDSKGRYVLEKLEILAGATHVRLGGWLAPPAPGDLLWRAHLHSSDSLFAAARPGDPAAVLDDVDLDAHFDPASATFATDKFTAHGPHLSGQFAFGVHLAPAGPEVKMDLQGQGSLLEALRLWPTFVNPDARKWCEENMRGGELVSGSLKIDWDSAALAAVLAKQAPPADSVNGRFTLRDAAVDLLPGLPTTAGLAATGVITGRYFHVEAPRGVMELGGGRRLAGANLSFTVPDTKPVARMPAEGAGRIIGGADALADLLMRDALKRYVGVVLDPNAIKGQFDGDLKLDLTLGKGVQPEEQKFRVAGNLSGLSIDKFLGNAKLEQGALEVVADRSQLKMTGTGQVLGAQAKLEVTKVGQDVGALVLTGNLDEAARAKLGFNSGPRLKGPVTLKLKAPLDKSGAEVEIDLAKATLESLGGAPWKLAGRPGKATFQLKPAPEGVQVNNLVIEAGAVSGRGSAMFNPEGALKSLKLAPFRMGASDDLKLDIEGGPTAKVTLRGATLDARSVVKGITASEPGRASQDLDLDVKVGSVLGYNREQISGFDLTASRHGGAFTALDAHGRFGRAAFSARSGDSNLILIKSDDAGALARFLDLYGKLQGGAIELSVRENSEGARGTATIRRFAIRDEPSLSQLQQAAPARQNTARGSNSVIGADPSPPVSFDKLSANFTRVGGRLDVRNGVVASASFGLTTQGFIDFAKDKVDFNGVFVPLQQFNNALGGIPLLGTLLTGGQNEGVFAINYRVTGPASNPSLNFNPLSGMTPGILRKMFGAIDGTTPSPSQDAPDSPATSYAPTLQSR
jgi:hypothetical protein